MRRTWPNCKRRAVSSHGLRAGSAALAGVLALARLVFAVLVRFSGLFNSRFTESARRRRFLPNLLPSRSLRGLAGVAAVAAQALSFSAVFSEAVAASGQYNSTGSAQSIVDESCTGTPSGAAMTVNVPTGGTITDIDVGVRATHTYRGALDVFVTSPQGTTATLAEGVGDGAVNMHARFNDEAGTVIGGSTHPSTSSYDSTFNRRPESAGALAAFDGEEMAGNWTIRICDFDAYGDSGQLLSAHLHITYTAAAPAPTGSQQCASLTGAWSGSTATSGGITVTRTLGTSGGGTWGSSSTNTMNTINAWSETAVQGRASLVDTFQWPGGPTSSSGNRGTYTVSFNKPVTNPVFHIDRVGGYSGSVSNSSKWILASSGTMYRLAGVDHFDTFADNSFIRTIGDTTTNSESSLSTANGTAAGSVLISGTHSSVSFTVEGHSVGSGGASDQIEMVVCAPQADLSLAKSVDNATPTTGQDVTFTLTLTNDGPEDAPNVQVTDLLPAGLTFVSATPSQGTYTSGTGVWDIGTVANGTSPTLQIVATVNSTGSITNTAEVTASGYVDPDSTPGDGGGDDYASVGITSSAPSNISCPAGSTATGSGYASGGSGGFRDEVFWFDWNCGGTTSFPAGSTVAKSWSLPNGTIVSATITGITQSISPYSSGDWTGDMFPSVYGGVNPVGLINTVSGEDPSYTLSFSVTHGGVPVALDFVAAEVEETASAESLSITTSASAFELLEQFGSITVSGAGTSSVTITGSGAGGTALVSSHGSPTFNVALTAGGKQAFGFGVRLKRDFSDAPTSGYGGGDHRRIGSWLIGADATTEMADYNDANAAGDTDDGVVLPAMVQGEPVIIPVTVSGAGGYLQAWIDWNGDGSFGGAGEQIASDIQDGGAGDSDGTANGTIELAVTVPATAITTQTFARFRWSTATGVASSGSANDGEIEDYALTVTAAAPALSITKTASDTTDVTAGQTITYTYTITNTGNQTISAIRLSDAHGGSGTAPAPDADSATLTDNAPAGDSANATTGDGEWDALAPGDVLTVTAPYTVTQNDVDTLQ